MTAPEPQTSTESGSSAASHAPRARDIELPLERDVFLRTLVRELAGTLQDVVGMDEASGFISVVGQRMGEQINADYKAGLGVDTLSPSQVADVLVDLKQRIQGDFALAEQSPDRLVFTSPTCPFGDKVQGRPSMCMMTSNVFGVVAAENLGQAKVVLEQTIANGAPGCRVVVHLKTNAASEAATGRQYLRAG